MTAPHGEAQQDPASGQVLDVVVVGGSQSGLAMACTSSVKGCALWCWRPPLSWATPGATAGTR